jgi:4-hydroxy-tetrahydrodipicolinate reductase
MGKTISALAKSDPSIDITARCDLGDSIEPPMKNCDVAIDFSKADATAEICRVALEHSKPIVIGTTGHSQDQRRIIEETARSVPIVFASNFSIGVNVLFWLTRKAAEQLGSDFDPEIIETHHKMKKDAPSGTAKTLADVLKTGRKMQSEIPIRSIREGDVVGEHTVILNASRGEPRNFCARRLASGEMDYRKARGTLLDAGCARTINL